MDSEPTVFHHLIAAADSLNLPVIGRSSQGRPLCAGSFGKGSGGPLVIVAGVHGDEPSTVAAVVELCERMRIQQPGARPVWVMPVMNPDGIVAGTKNSARDVDLNRNFPASSFSVDHRPGYDPGDAPLSEPETRAFHDLITALSPAGVVAVHAPFACVNYDGPAAAWAQAVSRACGWPVRENIGYPTPGSLGSWMGVDRGIPVLTLEFPAGAYEDFRPQALAALQTAINQMGIG